MQEVDLKPSAKIKVKKDGVEYFLRKPKMGEVLALESKTKELKEKNESGNADLIGFLVTIGLPQEVALDLDQDEIEQVIAIVSSSKKKA